MVCSKLFFNNSNGFYHNVAGRLVILACGNGSDLVNYVNSFDNFAEGSILTVQVGCICVANKELGGSRIGVGAASHGDNSSLVGEGIVHAVCLEFTLYSFL